MIAVIRPNIHPRCDRHHSQMTNTATHANTCQGYRCQEAGCVRHYDASNGYFDSPEGGGISYRFRLCCPNDGSTMYCVEFNEETGANTWRCAQPACDYQQLVVDEEAVILPSNELLGE